MNTSKQNTPRIIFAFALFLAIVAAMWWHAARASGVSGLPSAPTFTGTVKIRPPTSATLTQSQLQVVRGISNPTAYPIAIFRDSSVGGEAIVNIDAAGPDDNPVAALKFSKKQIDRWYIKKTGGTEIGGNWGSDLVFASRADTGAALTDVLTLKRATGAAEFSGAASFGNNVSVTGDISLSGTAWSSKPCATDYVRKAPNLCLRPVGASDYTNAPARDVCVELSALVPEGASALILRIYARVFSANAIGPRYVDVSVWSQSGCPGAGRLVAKSEAYEFSALAPGNTLGADMVEITLPTGSPGFASIKFTDDAGNQGNMGYEVVGYVD